MAYSAHYPYGTHSTDSDRFASEFLAALDVAPTDRIGPPRKRPIGKWLRWAIVLFGTASASALHVDDPTRWPRWWSEASTIAAPLVERVSAAVMAHSRGAADPQAVRLDQVPTGVPGTTLAMPTRQEARDMPAADAQVVAEPVEKMVESPPEVAAVETVAPSAQRAIDDPGAARAIAAGLHPDVSRVLLARLSDADYRNAGVAIRKALADTPDDDVLYWPLKTKAGVAQFQVHFVPGADEGCRRYVVTIAKDGWATTALPMDNCTVKRSAAAKSG